MKHIATVRCPLAQESVKVFQFSCDWIPDSYLLIEESLSGCYRGINHLRESRNGMYQPIFSSVFRFFQEQINPETLEFDDKKLNETDNIFVSIEFYPTAIEHSPEHPEHPMYTI